MCDHEYDVLVIGDANVDLILRGEDLMPDFGQAEKLVADASMQLGGSAAIFACGASRLGLCVGFIGKLGNDAFGSYLLGVMETRGIDTSHILVDHTVGTGLTVHFSRPRDRAMLTFPGTINTMSCDEIDEKIFSHARLVHLGSYYLQTRLHTGLAGLFRRLKQNGLHISLDPGWDPLNKWNGNLRQVLDQIDFFFPNDQEAARISGEPSVDRALRALQSHRLQPVIKRGEKGACSIDKNLIVEQTGFSVPNVDTTGAGDSFDAGFLYAYLQGKDTAECLRWGCACGALSTMRPGGIDGQPTREQVEDFLQKQADQGQQL